jgi:hypothetical protein
MTLANIPHSVIRIDWSKRRDNLRESGGSSAIPSPAIKANIFGRYPERMGKIL